MGDKLGLVRILLEKRRARQKEGKFVVEGPHLVEEAHSQIAFIVYSEDLPLVKKLLAQGVLGYKVSRKQFADLSQVETPQGILAVVNQKTVSLTELLKKKNPVLVFCEQIQDPGNLGTIIRTADAAGVDGVILSKGTVDLYNAKTVRATMGSLFHLPIVQIEDSREAINHFKKAGWQVMATALGANKSYFEVDYRKGTVILVGNEGAGIGEDLQAQCDLQVKIPLPGKAESLNVAVSTAVVLYEALRQRFNYGK